MNDCKALKKQKKIFIGEMKRLPRACEIIANWTMAAPKRGSDAGRPTGRAIRAGGWGHGGLDLNRR